MVESSCIPIKARRHGYVINFHEKYAWKSDKCTSSQNQSIDILSLFAAPINLNFTCHGEENGIHYHWQVRLASSLSTLDGARNDVHSSTYHPFASLSELPPHFLCVGGKILPSLVIYSHNKAKVFGVFVTNEIQLTVRNPELKHLLADNHLHGLGQL